MITKEKVLKVVARLKTVEELGSNGGFEMFEGGVPFDINGHPCGTTHCLAGLYVVANYKHPSIQKEISGRLKGNYNDIGFGCGAELMSNDLGFESRREFTVWVKAHPKEWGNSYGGSVFYRERAFNHPNFSGAIKHFEEFAGRLKC